MKKQSSDQRKIFSSLVLFFTLLGIGTDLSAATRRFYFSLASNFDSQYNGSYQCNPNYQPGSRALSGPINTAKSKVLKAKQLKATVAMANLPRFGVNNTTFGISYNLQDSYCGDFYSQNNRAYLTTLFNNAWQGIESFTDFSQTLTPATTVNNLSANIANTETPIPAAVWLFSSAMIGLLGIARRKRINV